MFWHVPAALSTIPREQVRLLTFLRGLVSVGRFLCGAALLCSLGSGGGASGYGLPSWTNDEEKLEISWREIWWARKWRNMLRVAHFHDAWLCVWMRSENCRSLSSSEHGLFHVGD
jgi:hypothetical protein